MTIRTLRRILVLSCGLLLLLLIGMGIDGALSGHLTGSRLTTLACGAALTAVGLRFIGDLNRRERSLGGGAVAMSSRARTIRLGLIAGVLVLILTGIYVVMSQAPSQ